MARELGMGIDINVSRSLHPQNVGSLEDYDDDTSGILQQVIEALQFAYKGVGKVHAAKEAVKLDPSMTEAAQVLRTAVHADKVFSDAAAKIDRVSAAMQNSIDAIEKELSQPVQARAAHTIAVEIRNFIRTQKCPTDFVIKAINSGDVDTVSAVLGAPSFLTGLDDAMQSTLLRMWHEKQNPQSAKRVRAMKAALGLLGSNAPLLHGEIKKAIGINRGQVQIYREARARTAKAFAS